MDCATGESEIYSIDQLPDWVDRVQPEDFIMTQLNNKGEYVHGYLNFSDKDKYRTSPGRAILYNDGNCYLFTGLTSVGADESAIGLSLIHICLCGHRCRGDHLGRGSFDDFPFCQQIHAVPGGRFGGKQPGFPGY